MCNCLETPAGFDVGPVREMLKTWLLREGMSLHDCIQWFSIEGASSNCFERATKTIPTKCNLGMTVKKPPQRVTFSLDLVKASVGGQNFKQQPKVVALETTGQFAGANSKNFQGGTHWVLLIHFHQVPKPFCVVYDPDASATPQAIAMWDTCTKLGDANKITFESPHFATIIQKMILGEGNNLGPLIRYYYGD